MGIEYHPLAAQPCGQASVFDDLHYARVQAGQPEHGAGICQARFTFDQHLQRRILDIRHPTQIEYHNARLMFRHQCLDPVGDRLSIDEEQAPLGAQNQQSLKGLVIRMLFRDRAQHIGTALAPDNMDIRIGCLAGQTDQGKDDGNDDTLQCAEDDHSEKSRHTTITGYTEDANKYNEAQKLGWKVLRYTAINYKNITQDLKEIIN